MQLLWFWNQLSSLAVTAALIKHSVFTRHYVGAHNTQHGNCCTAEPVIGKEHTC